MSQTKAQLISDLVQALNFTGTASAPANGLFLSAANTLKLSTASTPRLTINSDGHVDVVGNLDVGAGIDVTGNITVSGTVDGVDVAALSSTVSGLSNTTINNNVDNRLITGSNTANTLNGESTATYDASLLNITSTTQGLGLRLTNTSNEYTEIKFSAARTAASSALGILTGRWNNTNDVCQIYLQAGDDTTNKDDGRISFLVNSAAGANKTALRIEPDASVQLPNNSQKLQLGAAQKLNLWHGGSNGYIDNEAGDLNFRVTASNTNAMHIHSSARISIGTTSDAVGGAPSSQLGQFNVLSSTASGQWVMQGRADNVAGNGLFLRAGHNSSYYTAYLTGYDENNVHMVVRGDGNIGIGTASPGNPLHVRNTTTDLLKLDCNDDGALGAHMQLNHDSSSPADNDVVGAIEFSGKDSGGNATIYSRIRGVALDVTDGSEDGALVFGTRVNASFGERMRIDGDKLSTGGEDSPDVSSGGLCLNQGSEGTNILTFKSSDIAHGVTTFDETDTYFSARKSSDNKGGLRLHAFTDAAGADPAFEFHGIIASDADGGYVPFEFRGHEANGTGTQNIATNRRIAKFTNSDGSIISSITGNGITFGNETATDHALDDYEEGTWTPADASGGGISVSASNNRFTKIGRMVFASGRMAFGSSSDGSTAKITLPFAPTSNVISSAVGSACFEQSYDSNNTVMACINDTGGVLFRKNGSGNLKNNQISGTILRFCVYYMTST